jgi:hypothetical protein
MDPSEEKILRANRQIEELDEQVRRLTAEKQSLEKELRQERERRISQASAQIPRRTANDPDLKLFREQLELLQGQEAEVAEAFRRGVWGELSERLQQELSQRFLTIRQGVVSQKMFNDMSELILEQWLLLRRLQLCISEEKR